ncbi:MAG TPA: LysR substrate-binding domain-containing protein [Tepidisphaeraceae bacterium]|nr:LysR substrate-binding domain-containing protein [Tepidisphaeraceae bacterium]
MQTALSRRSWCGERLFFAPFSSPNDIFSLGQELVNALENQPAGRPLRLAVGLVDVIPKPVARLLLEPAMRLPQPVRLICREDKADRLLADLSARRLDMVLSDGPIRTAVGFQGFNHLLGECGVCFFAAPKLAKRYGQGFPKSLDGAPMLMPTGHSVVRRSLDLWFDSQRIHPVVVADFDDSALMFSFGQSGEGIFPAPSVMERNIQREVGVRLVGRASRVRERFYAISMEEHPTHPALIAIRDAARQDVFQETRK